MTDVSVILPVYNGVHTLERAIKSILAQKDLDIEIIIVDDGSNDGSNQIINNYSHIEKIKTINNSFNKGISAARNAAIDLATGKWIALIDADDAWKPGRLLSMIQTSAETDDMVADGLITFDPVAKVETGSLFEPIAESDFPLDKALVGEAHGKDIDIGILKPIIKREFLNQHRIRYDTDLHHGEDLVFYVRILLAGARLRILPDAYYIYTSPYGRLSRQKSPYARSKRDGAAIADTLEKIERTESARLSPEHRRAFARKAYMIRDAAFWFDFEEFVHERKYVSAIFTLLKWRNLKKVVHSEYFWNKLRRVLRRLI